MKLTELVRRIKPYVIGWVTEITGGPGPYAPSPHDLNSAHHEGSIADTQGPQFLLTDGARALTDNMAVAAGKTIDGVDISAHKSGTDTHAGQDAKAAHTGGLGTHSHQTAGAEGGKIDHGAALDGLGDDDHTIYLKADGTRSLTDDMVVAAGKTIDGVDISAHKSAYDAHDGADAKAAHTGGLGTHSHQTAGAEGGKIDHGSAIDGLGDDDHTIYVKADGTRAMSGTLQSQHLIPIATDTYDLGSSTKLYRKGWLSELEALLFVENAAQVVGGYFIVPHGQGTFAEDVDNSETQIDFGQAMTPNDFVLLRGNGNVEYLQVLALVSGTTYNVTRNMDGSGANTWPQGHVFVVLGASGDGRIEFDAQTGGPRISVFRQGATYNASTEQFRIGDLNGWGPISSEVYGWAAGDYAGTEYAYYSTADGMVVRGTIKADDGYLHTLCISGILTIEAAAGEIRSGVGVVGVDFDGFRLFHDGAGVPRIAIYDNDVLTVALGDLNGIFGIASHLHGIGIGDYANNKYLRYEPTGGMVVRGKIYADDGELYSLDVLGALNISTNGVLKSGATGFGAGTGFFFDYNAGNPRAYVGSATKYLTFDTSTGLLVVRGEVKADTGYLKDLTVSGALNISTSGVLKSGATAYMTGTGWWLDYNAGSPRFRIGDPTDEYFRWTGSLIEISAAGGGLTIGAGGLVSDLNNGMTVKTDKTDGSTLKRLRFLSNNRAALQGNAFLHQYSTLATHSRMLMNHWDDTVSGAGAGPTNVFASEIWDAANPKRLIGAYSSPAVGSDQGTLKYAISTDGSQIHPDFVSGETTFGIAALDWMACVVEKEANRAHFYLNGNVIRVVLPKTPASAGASGVKGNWCWDSNYFYVCVNTNTWKRTALSTW
ncbi:MAG: hypothetical protein KAY24_00150 [Candidatus Eisenbacteria sp.]|nr:hypothetical protein [Candidatus Eisenbacteria bacterium]